MEDIQIILKEYYPNSSLMFMDDNASKLVFRIRLILKAHKANDDILLLNKQLKKLMKLILKVLMVLHKLIIPNDDTKITSIIVKENGSFVEKKNIKLLLMVLNFKYPNII